MKNYHGLLKCIFFRDYRTDGVRVKNMDPLQKLMPYVMKTRNESCIYYRQQIDLTRTIEYIRKNNRNLDNQRISLFVILLCAIIRTTALKPRMNRFVAGKRVYKRNHMQLSYIVKKEMSEEGSEAAVKQTFDLNDTIEDVARKVNASIEEAKRGSGADSDALIGTIMKLPGSVVTVITGIAKMLHNRGIIPASLIDSDPLFSSGFVANLGSIGIDAPYHHLYEWGTVSFFVVMGKYRRAVDIEKDGITRKKMMVDVTFTIDERIADGYYFTKALKVFKKFMENPELLARSAEKIAVDE